MAPNWSWVGQLRPAMAIFTTLAIHGVFFIPIFHFLRYSCFRWLLQSDHLTINLIITIYIFALLFDENAFLHEEFKDYLPIFDFFESLIRSISFLSRQTDWWKSDKKREELGGVNEGWSLFNSFFSFDERRNMPIDYKNVEICQFITNSIFESENSLEDTLSLSPSRT